MKSFRAVGRKPIARETEVSIDTVRSRLRLAKERMRERIESDDRLREISTASDPIDAARCT